MKEVLNKLGLKTILCVGDENLTTNDGILNLHFTEGTHWATYINENYFDSYRFSPLKLLSDLIFKANGIFVVF